MPWIWLGGAAAAAGRRHLRGPGAAGRRLAFGGLSAAEGRQRQIQPGHYGNPMPETKREPGNPVAAALDDRAGDSAVIAALSAGGSEVRFVGGCVRDAVLGPCRGRYRYRHADAPRRVIELLEAAGLKAVPTGIDHGTVTAVALHRPSRSPRCAATSRPMAGMPRSPSPTTGSPTRRGAISPSTRSPARRTGRLYDPFGGIADLKRRRVRFVGRRRATASAKTCCGCCASSASMPISARRRPMPKRWPPPRRWRRCCPRCRASGSRPRRLKLLAAADPAPVMRLMQDHGVLAHFLPEAERLDRLARLVAIESSLSLSPSRRAGWRPCWKTKRRRAASRRAGISPTPCAIASSKR